MEKKEDDEDDDKKIVANVRPEECNIDNQMVNQSAKSTELQESVGDDRQNQSTINDYNHEELYVSYPVEEDDVNKGPLMVGEEEEVREKKLEPGEKLNHVLIADF